MRLTPETRSAIQDVVSQHTEGQGKVWLFGSRTDDAARGGDIDLLVELPIAVERPAVLAAAIGAGLQMRLGEQKIDVLLKAPNLPLLPIHRVAQDTGVPL